MKDYIKPTNSFAAIAHNVGRSIGTGAAFLPYLGKFFLSFCKLLTELKNFNAKTFYGALTRFGPNSLVMTIVTSLLIGAITARIIGSYFAIFKNEILVVNIIYNAVIRHIIPVLIGILMLLRAGVTSTITTYLYPTTSFQKTAEKQIWPHLFALCLTMPLLYIYASFISMFAGAIWINNALNIPFSNFLMHLQNIAQVKDFLVGMGSELLFALEIIIISSFYGWQFKMKQLPLGQAVRSMLIMGLFILILTDFYIEFIFKAMVSEL